MFPATSAHHVFQQHRLTARRWFMQQCGVGLGSVALTSLLSETAAAGEPDARNITLPRPHFPAKAKNVIFLFMAGAPSHLELFDNKPQLARFDGTLPPAELLKGYRAAFINPNSKLQFNWDYTHRGDVTTNLATTPSGEVFGFGTRLAVDF